MFQGDPVVGNGTLKAYIHRFKTEASRCNFTNDATTIRIFVKGLKNVHSLAIHIYEKGTQLFNDAISEVEKLNTTQRVTATIIPLSMVNVMSNKADHCFQCQETAHTACNYTHIGWYECYEYGHIVMDCPHKIPPSGTPVTQHKPHRNHHARLSLKEHCEDRGRQSQSRSQLHLYRHCSLIHCNSYRGQSR